jgi:DNA topoisomerase I
MIRRADTLRRIQRLAIPPAWKDVWICPIDEGHIQAVGRDARNRKQYRYHSRWRETRDETKYHRMVAFGKALPNIRRRVAVDLKANGLPREKVLATVVRLLETTFVRVGNKEYTKQNDSFGLTTLRDRHVHISGTEVQFYFRGKSGVKHAINVKDPYLARIVRRLRDLPGYELFQYIDEEGNQKTIGSADVNEYLRETAGDDFSAKDFRTWAGTVLAAEALSGAEFRTGRQALKNVKSAVAWVAERLGNTVSVCRKCYIHPAVPEAYLEGALALNSSGKQRWLSASEAAVLSFLQKRLRSKKPLSLEQSLTKSIRQLRAEK